MEIVLRVTIIYLFVLVGMRILGKREFGQMSPFELVTLLLIPEIVTDTLTGDDSSLTAGLIGVTTIFGLVFIITIITHISKRAEKVMEGSPTVLVIDGRILEDALNQERVNADEIFIEMHRTGVERLEQVKWAILENDGKISIVPGEKSNSGHQESESII
ncbi:MAG: YetF domain-containing protein [Balneolaceae bacterium]